MGRGTGAGTPWHSLMSRYRGATGPTTQFLRSHGNEALLRAVQNYTGAGYATTNELTRIGLSAFREKHGAEASRRELENVRSLQVALNRAMAAGHSYSGAAYRGADVPESTIGAWLKRGEVVTNSIWSTTASRSVAKQFQGRGNVFFKIKKVRGVPLEGVTKIKREHEVALPVGKRFKITHATKRKGKYVLTLEEK